jgi:CheY-like chemotaxis protein
VGLGSEFWIELNRDVAPTMLDDSVVSTKLLSQVSVESGMCRLLCVEDNSANLMLVQQIIEDQPNVSIFSARDGRQAIEMARTLLPDVILMDINLPDISGREALIILKNDPITAHIPVLAISANAIPSEIQKGLEAGFSRYLTKPIKVSEFIEALVSVSENAKLMSRK